MKYNNKISFTVFEVVMITLLAISFMIFPWLQYLPYFEKQKFEDFLEVSNNFAGVLIPLLTFFGSILVYVAFKAQIRANEEIKNQFNQQNFENLYFRLIDNLDNRIKNYTLTDLDGNKTHSGYNILSYFRDEIVKEERRHRAKHSIQILCDYPYMLDDEDYLLFFEEIDKNEFDTIENFKLKFKISSSLERAEIIDRYTVTNRPNQWNSFIGQIFAKHFYELPIEFYNDYYTLITKQLFNKYSTFFDGYFRNLRLILNHINKVDNKEFYYDFLEENVTTLEKTFILAYVATGRTKIETTKMLRYSHLLDSLHYVEGIRFVDTNFYIRHIQNILSQY